jgi:hypothetical protein
MPLSSLEAANRVNEQVTVEMADRSRGDSRVNRCPLLQQQQEHDHGRLGLDAVA